MICFLFWSSQAPGGMGGCPECICLAGEAWGDQEDDGHSSKRHRETGGHSRDGGQRQTEGEPYVAISPFIYTW